ncbi:SH3 domain-containing protein [Atopobacter phocae]|uniref:SH3 domain-containing protein n=1 Tax=Atopobacter phocae TaxID=136492 RepID=UPI00046EBFCB|nr:SH3 domain-containing protein [Atopobacter phocae]
MNFVRAMKELGITVIDRRNIAPFSNPKRSVNQVTHLGIHHTGVSVDQPSERLEHYWRTAHGWGTGGYHVYIRRTSQVEWNYQPDQITNGVGNHNHYVFHISVAGNGSFTSRQNEVLVAVIQYWCRNLNIPPHRVLGHREFRGHESNSCPGRDMQALRRLIQTAGQNHSEQSITHITESSRQQQAVNQVKQYEERGTFYPSTTINIRSAPSVTSDIVGQYVRGEHVHYDRVQVDPIDGYVWISWIGASGKRRWMVIRERKNGQTQPMWGYIQ